MNDETPYVKSPWQIFRKRPLAVFMRKLEAAETIYSKNGPLLIPAGDWLAIDALGDPYPVSNNIFEKTYDAVDAADMAQMSVTVPQVQAAEKFKGEIPNE